MSKLSAKIGAKVGVIGAGAWGTAIAAHCARIDHEVTIWAREREVVDEINAQHANSLFLKGAKLPSNLRATTDIGEALAGAELIVMVPPAQHVRKVAELMRPYVGERAPIACASKGIEESTLLLLNDVLAEALPDVDRGRIAFVSGPSFAAEVARGLPTDVTVASTSKQTQLTVSQILHSPMFRIYTSDDPIGVEVGGAVKNVIAVAAGACDGLRFGRNARAALVTRGLAEITRLGVALGGNPLTFLGMAGAGDLFLTCNGSLSRNRTLGLKVALGLDPKKYLAEQRSVAEGYYTSAAAHALAKKLNVEMPITEQVYLVLHEGRPILEAVTTLLTRSGRVEHPVA